jgi:hypothetical protein
MQPVVIEKRIYEIRGYKIMFDFDLADLYIVDTKALNQAVKRNRKRFPKDFMFKLTKKEWLFLRSQIVTLENGRGKFPKYLPYVFTEHGVTMLASVLKSDRAAKMNIAIVRAFIALRKFTFNYKELSEQVREIRNSVISHAQQIEQIYSAIENIIEIKENEKKHYDRPRIGFVTINADKEERDAITKENKKQKAKPSQKRSRTVDHKKSIH